MLKKIVTWKGFPFWFFHLPTVPYIVFLIFKARSFFFYGSCNPIAKSWAGGQRTSKRKILQHINPRYLPQTKVLSGTSTRAEVENAVADMNFPLILKPDRGERGTGVEKVHDLKQLQKILPGYEGEVLLQECLTYPYEYGVLYYRIPGSEKGKITSLSVKALPSVTGDGKKTLAELVSEVKKFRRYRDLYHRLAGERWRQVPEKGEQVVLDYVAQQIRGTQFLDVRHLITPEVEALFDRICGDIPGFYLGRFDLMAAGPDSLTHGNDLKILELNGTASMPIHIFDPKVSTFEAYREMYRQWRLIYEISVLNHKNGVPYTRLSDAVRYLGVRFSRKI